MQKGRHSENLQEFANFDGNQQFSKEIQISAYSTLQNHTSNPFSDIPAKKTMYLNRLPPWTDPENLQNLMCRVSGGSTVKVGINSGSCSDIIWALIIYMTRIFIKYYIDDFRLFEYSKISLYFP